MGLADKIHELNVKFAESKVGQYFKVTERRTTLTTELRAGIVSFLAVAYILAVNANIVKDSGGPCSYKDCTGPVKTPDCVFFDEGYTECQEEVKRSLIAATAVGSLLTCFLMGAVANMPLAVAPGMGINAYFTYTVVGFKGTGKVAYSEAMAAILIESFIFWFLALTGVRGYLIRFVPKNILFATAGGIGLFLAHIGLQGAEGIGLVTYDGATLVTIGACPLNERISQYSLMDKSTACVVGKTGQPEIGPGFMQHNSYSCMSKGKLRNGPFWLGVWGGMLMVVLLAKRVKGAIMIGILFVTFISWIHTDENTATYLGPKSQIPGGEARLAYWKKGVATPDVSKTAVQFDFGAFGRADLWVALITFLYVDFLDTTGTLYSMATFMDRMIPGFVDKKTKSFPGQLAAFMMDGVGIFIGSFLGIPPLTVYVESATGIKEGGRTGLTAITISFFFFLSLFFTPIFASIPPYATGPALILVGALMMENVVLIEWHKVEVAIPAFLTIALMPLTYSIAYGVLGGLLSSITINVMLYIINFATAIINGTLAESGLLPTPANISRFVNEAMGTEPDALAPPIADDDNSPKKQVDSLPVTDGKTAV